MAETTYDVEVQDHGSIQLILPQNDNAHTWLRENTDGQWIGGGLAVEPRYVFDLLIGMWHEGYNVPIEEKS